MPPMFFYNNQVKPSRKTRLSVMRRRSFRGGLSFDKRGAIKPKILIFASQRSNNEETKNKVVFLSSVEKNFI